ncbi:spermatogenesis-associated protein 2 [Chanos chanos]|uniref:Spermatogenesis-associated protein 2 n=1 Tax=Chanos chanos TaxID=29144 RepID=A0A6J2ULX6_CHACN|nr:spermatogenesis-associated protein 2-like [Chanos chanos]
MTNSVLEQSPVARKDVFECYLMYYDRVWQHGNIEICKETQVIEQARHVLLSQDQPGGRCTLFDLYETVIEGVKHGSRDCRRFIGLLIKASEMLEMLCVNLFLFPWKKEIKTLKTFTGPFVYFIEPVLPSSVVKSILQSIGYNPSTDTEYRLAEKVNPDSAKKVGFELFLTRLECEHLLELMGQRSHADCLEILHTKTAPITTTTCAGENAVEPNQNETTTDESVDEDRMVNGRSLVNPNAVQAQNSEKNSLSLEVQQTMQDTASGVRQATSFITEDKSILEMQQNYPDLAIRQKPIFRKPQGSVHGLKAKEKSINKKKGAAHIHEIASDMSGPQSIAMHTLPTLTCSVTTAPNQIPEEVTESLPVDDKAGQASEFSSEETPRPEQGAAPGPDSLTKDSSVTNLIERMGRVNIKECSVDEPLKYPIEETAQAQPSRSSHIRSTASPLGSPRTKNQPIMCNPSQQPVCNIAGCGTCAGSDAFQGHENTIKEPPRSLYVLPNSLGECAPALDHRADCQTACSQSQSGKDVPSSPTHRSPTQPQSEDELDTFVML